MHAMIIAATYSRYSSDNQRETSIEDQERQQTARITAEDWSAGGRYSDRELSAATPMALRPGGRAMLDAAARGEFHILLIEALDRCWRDIVDQERTIRRLEMMGIRIIGVADGYDTRHDDRELQRGVRGILNQQYLRDLAKKTHRGLTGQVLRGGHAGGLAYGYRSIARGAVQALEVDVDQATWVHWIHERYGADGWSCQRIAAELNRLGVRTGRGGTWSVSALYGSPNKGSGVLNNEAYIGRYIWNRSAWVKDPDTGKRLRIARPESEWIVESRPDLRILDDATWQATRARMDGARLSGGSKGKGARPRTLFGGLMVCAKCGGTMIAVSPHQYGCAQHKDRGPAVCAGTYIRRSATDTILMGIVRRELLDPSAIVEMRERVAALLNSARRDAAANDVRAKLADTEREIERLVDAIAAVGHSDAIAARLRTAEVARDRLRAQAVAAAAAAPSIDDLMARYKRQVVDLQTALQADTDRARAALRDYFGPIRIEETADGTWAEISAHPATLLLGAAVGDSGFGCGGAIHHPESRRVRIK